MSFPDDKLLWEPYVELARLDVASLLRDRGSPDYGYVEVEPMVKVEVEVEEAQYELENKVKVEIYHDMEETVHYDHDTGQSRVFAYYLRYDFKRNFFFLRREYLTKSKKKEQRQITQQIFVGIHFLRLLMKN